MNNASKTYTSGVDVPMYKTLKYRFFPNKHMKKEAWQYLVTKYKTPLEAHNALKAHVFPVNKLHELFDGFFLNNAYKMLYVNEDEELLKILEDPNCVYNPTYEEVTLFSDGLCYTFYPSNYLTQEEWNYFVFKYGTQTAAHYTIITLDIFPDQREYLFKDFEKYKNGMKEAGNIFNSYYGVSKHGGKSRRRKTHKKTRRTRKH